MIIMLLLGDHNERSCPFFLEHSSCEPHLVYKVRHNYLRFHNGDLVPSSDGNDTPFLYGLHPIAEKMETWGYMLADITNTPRQLTDGQGRVTLTGSYTPWGSLMEYDGKGNFVFGYFGGLLDSATGLMYVGDGQYYDPATGRFLTRGVNPNSPNPYVPLNPMGAVLGPLGWVMLAYRSKQNKRRKSTAWMVFILVLAMSMFLAGCSLYIPGCDWWNNRVGAKPPETPPIQPQPSPSPAPAPTPEPAPPPTEPPAGPPSCDDCAPTPGPTPTVTKTIFFGGSGGSLDPKGPDPYYQTKVWADSATQVVRFPGGGSDGKPDQANEVDINTYKDVNLIVIGYSAGGDTALIFADKYRTHQIQNSESGKITDIAVLGGTMTGKMTDGRDLAQEWRGVLDNLLMWGTDIYIQVFRLKK